MSLPAAAAPVAVLVLAWDETTPAVRALVAAPATAESAVESVMVLVPAGPATDELTQEEFLPLAAPYLADNTLAPVAAAGALLPVPAPAAPLAPAGGAGPASAPGASAAPPAELTSSPAVSFAVGVRPSSAGVAAALPAAAPLASGPGGLAALSAAALSGPAARILRLSEHSLATLAAHARQALPAPAWLGTAAPAAPYLGSSAAPGATALARPPSAPTAAPMALVAGAAPPLRHSAAAGYPPAELPAAPAAEPTALVAPGAAAPLPTAASISITEQSEAAEFASLLAAEVAPAQAGWPDALASLRAPAVAGQAAEPAATAELAPALFTQSAPPASSAVATADEVAYAALLPKTSRFDAPNLNFQIIQYARFAVPLVLAAPPFAVIYAPAWPTWLAAQELRQRTGWPLVLHLAALAAEDEPLHLAAGWPAEIQRQALHRADLILTETPALAYRLRRELDLPAHRVRPVPAADAAAVARALSTVQAR